VKLCLHSPIRLHGNFVMILQFSVVLTYAVGKSSLNEPTITLAVSEVGQSVVGSVIFQLIGAWHLHAGLQGVIYWEDNTTPCDIISSGRGGGKRNVTLGSLKFMESLNEGKKC